MIVFGLESSTSFSGNVDLYSMFRMSNSNLIRLPYRLVNLNAVHQSGDFELHANLAVEHRLRKDTAVLSDSSPQDISLDLRELFVSWYTDFGEIRAGKQIHSWGMTDENSPLDNINAYDYYYLFFGGSDRKIGSFSLTMDYYINDWKFGVLFSPIHSSNRMPLNDSEFPIQFSAVPNEYQIMKIDDNQLEYGGYLQKSFSNCELRITYYSGFDRLYNLSGINVFTFQPNDLSFTEIDVVYGFRKTQQIGFGGVFLLNDLTIRGDIAGFETRDQNKCVIRENPNPISNYNNLEFSYPLSESAKYKQFTFQFEYGLPWDISIVGQYIGYDTISYTSNGLPIDDEIDITNLEFDPDNLDPRKIFIPGMGSPLAVLSKKAVLINLEKKFMDEKLKLNLASLLDVDNENFNFPSSNVGTLLELGFEYQLTEGFNINSAVTKINGDENHQSGEYYPFNQMEDFSHYRLELKYYF